MNGTNLEAARRAMIDIRSSLPGTNRMIAARAAWRRATRSFVFGRGFLYLDPAGVARECSEAERAWHDALAREGF